MLIKNGIVTVCLTFTQFTIIPIHSGLEKHRPVLTSEEIHRKNVTDKKERRQKRKVGRCGVKGLRQKKRKKIILLLIGSLYLTGGRKKPQGWFVQSKIHTET